MESRCAFAAVIKRAPGFNTRRPSNAVVIIGSTNWTNASQNNQEISVVQALNVAGLRAHTKRIEEMHETFKLFSEAHAREAIDVRVQRKEGNARDRARSAPSEDRYRIARRFSIANDIRLRGLTALGQK